MQGIITRGVGGFYYVLDAQGRTHQLRAQAKLRRAHLKPMVGDKVEFGVLMVSDESGVKVAKDAAAYKAVGEIVEQGKYKKIVVFKYKAKKNERKKQGHRQPFTAVKITEIAAK